MTTEILLEKLDKPIVVIGNGISDQQHGKFIDKHNTVIRFNNAVVEGYEKLIGSKTTHWCVNGNSRIVKQFNLKPFTPHIEDYFDDCVSRLFRKHVGCNPIYAEKDYRSMCGLDDPTAGFLLCYMLVAMDYDFDVVGFDGLITGHYFEPKHQHAKGHLPQAHVEFEWIRNHKQIRIFT